MLTTRQLVNTLSLGHLACKPGLQFADAHPDPKQAITYALTHAVNAPQSPEYGDREGFETGAFLRWAASDPKVAQDLRPGEDVLALYHGLGNWRADVFGHLEGCARILREWVAKVQTEHAAEAQS